MLLKEIMKMPTLIQKRKCMMTHGIQLLQEKVNILY